MVFCATVGPSSRRKSLRGRSFSAWRPTSPGWHHTGLVVAARLCTTVTTLEGNTNDDGSREGYEAIRRVRTLAAVDYIIMPS